MLATLPNIGVIDVWNRQSRVHSLIMPPLFGVNAFSDGGQGPEKPPIVEETDSEEEIFTFDYPKRGGEISDLVNPPIEGIAGKVYTAQTKQPITFVGARVVPNILSYLFIDPIGISREMAEPEFVSLTKQSAIASPYTGLLVYTSYADSNSHFSYASNSSYESSPSPRQEIYLKVDKPLYETRFPLPIFSERVYYQYQGGDMVDATPLTQSKSQAYQNTIQEPLNIEQPKFYMEDSTGQKNSEDLDLELGLKPNYHSSELELPFLRNESVGLDIGLRSTGNKAVSSSLNQDAYTNRDLTFSHRLDITEAPKARAEYKPLKDVVSLSTNLGFDEPLLRDRFIARLNAPVTEVEHPSISSGNQVRTSDSRLPAETYTAARNKSITHEAALPKLADFSLFPGKLVLDLDNGAGYVLERENILPYQSQSPVLSSNNALNSVNVGHRISEKSGEDMPAAPQPGYDFAQSGFILGQPAMMQIAHVERLTAVEYEPLPLVLGFDDPLLIKTVITGSHDTPPAYTARTAAKNGEAQLEPIRSTTSNVRYDSMLPDFDLEIPDNQPIEYGRARIALDPYGLFSLGNTALQGNYRDDIAVRSALLHSQDRTSTRNSLDNLVKVNYDSGRTSLPRTAATFDPYTANLLHPELQLQEDTGTTSTDNYKAAVSERDLERTVEEEAELTKEEPAQEVQEEVYNNDKAETGAYEKDKAKEENGTEAEKENDSLVSGIAVAAGAVGLGVLAGVGGLVGALFKKGDSEVKGSSDYKSNNPHSISNEDKSRLLGKDSKKRDDLCTTKPKSEEIVYPCGRKKDYNQLEKREDLCPIKPESEEINSEAEIPMYRLLFKEKVNDYDASSRRIVGIRANGKTKNIEVGGNSALAYIDALAELNGYEFFFEQTEQGIMLKAISGHTNQFYVIKVVDRDNQSRTLRYIKDSLDLENVAQNESIVVEHAADPNARNIELKLFDETYTIPVYTPSGKKVEGVAVVSNFEGKKSDKKGYRIIEYEDDESQRQEYLLAEGSILVSAIDALKSKGYDVKLKKYTLRKDGKILSEQIAIEDVYQDGRSIRVNNGQTGFMIETIDENGFVGEPIDEKGNLLNLEKAVVEEGKKYRMVVTHQGVYDRNEINNEIKERIKGKTEQKLYA